MHLERGEQTNVYTCECALLCTPSTHVTDLDPHATRAQRTSSIVAAFESDVAFFAAVGVDFFALFDVAKFFACVGVASFLRAARVIGRESEGVETFWAAVFRGIQWVDEQLAFRARLQRSRALLVCKCRSDINKNWSARDRIHVTVFLIIVCQCIYDNSL